MKKILIVALASGMLTFAVAKEAAPAPAATQTEEKGHEHKVAELVPLPHPVKVILNHKEEIGLTKEQDEKIQKEMLAVFPPKIHGGMDKAEELEKKIKEAVIHEHKTKEDLREEIEKLIEIKRQITYDHIDALNTLQKILTKEQQEKVKKLVLSQKNGKR